MRRGEAPRRCALCLSLPLQPCTVLFTFSSPSTVLLKYTYTCILYDQMEALLAKQEEELAHLRLQAKALKQRTADVAKLEAELIEAKKDLKDMSEQMDASEKSANDAHEELAKVHGEMRQLRAKVKSLANGKLLEKRFAQAQLQHKKEIAKLLSAHEDALASHAREWKMESDEKIKQMKEQLHKHYGNTISELKGQVEDLKNDNESQRTELQETNVELDRKVQSTQMLLQRIDNLAKDKRDAHKKYAGAYIQPSLVYNYLSCDIRILITSLSPFSRVPDRKHWKAAKRVGARTRQPSPKARRVCIAHGCEDLAGS